MSCGNYNNGWGGGCGCANTVQYAPPACNPNFPTYCTALGSGTIQRVVGEDSSYCKYTVPTLQSNSILFYNASTALISWGNGSVANPIFLGNGSGQATASSAVQLQATTPTGQLVAFNPTASTETQFPIVTAGGSTTNWGTIESIIPSQGLVYKNNSGTVSQLTGNQSQIVSFDANGNPVVVAGSTFVGGIPSGAIIPFAYNVTSGNIPAGWLLCDGSIYTVSAYPNLGALLANTYGGSTGTFAVPNLKGLFIRGAGTQTVSGTTYTSESIGTAQKDQFQGHQHGYAYQYVGGNNAQSGGGANGNGYGTTGTTNSISTDNTNGTPRYGSETRPVNLAMVYCIKI